MHEITLKCSNGCEQTFRVSGLTDDGAAEYCGILDGSSSFYVKDPRGTSSWIGRCQVCSGSYTASWRSVSDVR